jgi:hypothetical protein
MVEFSTSTQDNNTTEEDEPPSSDVDVLDEEASTKNFLDEYVRDAEKSLLDGDFAKSRSPTTLELALDLMSGLDYLTELVKGHSGENDYVATEHSSLSGYSQVIENFDENLITYTLSDVSFWDDALSLLTIRTEDGDDATSRANTFFNDYLNTGNTIEVNLYWKQMQ